MRAAGGLDWVSCEASLRDSVQDYHSWQGERGPTRRAPRAYGWALLRLLGRRRSSVALEWLAATRWIGRRHLARVL